MKLSTAVLIVWLLIGAIASAQRHDYSGLPASCDQVADIAITIVAGPLNYVGVDPRVDCHAPEPSK